MYCYLISYDQDNGSVSDYNDLYNAIKEYGTWANITESLWAIVTYDSAKEIRDNLSNYIDDKDRLFVVKSGTEAAWRNVICKNEWLKKNL